MEPIVVKLSDFWFYKRGRLGGLLLVPLHVTIGYGNFTVNWREGEGGKMERGQII